MAMTTTLQEMRITHDAGAMPTSHKPGLSGRALGWALVRARGCMDGYVTQTHIGLLIGRSQTWISRMERDGSRLNWKDLVLWCAALDVSVCDLITNYTRAQPAR